MNISSNSPIIDTCIPSPSHRLIHPVSISPANGLNTTHRNVTLMYDAPSPGRSWPSSTSSRSYTLTLSPTCGTTLLLYFTFSSCVIALTASRWNWSGGIRTRSFSLVSINIVLLSLSLILSLCPVL